MISVTCIVHHGDVDDKDTIVLPDGHVCAECYAWIEALLEHDDDNENELTLVQLNGDENDDDDDDDDDDDEMVWVE